MPYLENRKTLKSIQDVAGGLGSLGDETRKIKNLGTAHTYGPTLERLKQED